MPELDLWGSGRNPRRHGIASASRVTEAKSSVTRPWETKFLGYSMTVHRQPRLKVAARSVERFKDKVRQRVRVGRARRLIALGFTEAKGWCCAGNGRGPWWNAGAAHMNAAYPAAEFQRMGLVCLLATVKAHA